MKERSKTTVKQIMLVEDEELILEGLKNIIDWESLSMEVADTAANGEEALQKLEEHEVDIIVTDISMPVLDGLEFLEALRRKDTRTRCIILTGYEEFEYARKAILLDVEDYILKPINEEQLVKVLLAAAERLEERDRKSLELEDKTGWTQLLKGRLSPKEAEKYFSVLPPIGEDKILYPVLMKINPESLGGRNVSAVLHTLQQERQRIRVVYLSVDTLLLLCFTEEKTQGEEMLQGLLEGIQNVLESTMEVQTFLSVGIGIKDYEQLPGAYDTAKKQLKYQLVEGYGSCVTPGQLKNRQSADIEVDTEGLRRLILKKNKEDTANYIEDLFLNHIRQEMPVDDIYRLALKIAMLLSEIKEEYHLQGRENMHNLTELVESIYQVEDIPSLKGIFTSEVTEIIFCLNESDSHYTPVVKQIISEVQKNYREDMNLKTLSYKYHMNTSYLGQIFQKEVGCSFAQYLSNIKNGRAKELILNTNMKINDIAKEVGYTDTSYFYRKFKQCYGVSPAALREMKKY